LRIGEAVEFILEGNVMSKRETIVKDIDIMPEELVDKFFAMWIDEKAIEEEQYARDVLQAMDDVRHNRNISGPYKNAAELIRDCMED
jgi:hypothetical protein